MIRTRQTADKRKRKRGRLSEEQGKRADLVLWNSVNSGVNRKMELRSSTIATAQVGALNVSIPKPQPVHSCRMFGDYGCCLHSSVVSFATEAVHADNSSNRFGLSKQTLEVRKTRAIGMAEPKQNDATPEVEVDPEPYEMRANGEILTCARAEFLPLAQHDFLI